MGQNMIIRPMAVNEIDSTVNLCNYYRDEAQIPEDEYDENSVLEGIRFRNINVQYRWLNAYEGSRPVGFICGFLTPAPWNKNILYAQIELIFLLESHRSMDTFRQMVDEFEQWARAAGAKKIITGDIGVNVERSRKVYGHLGFDEALWMTKEIT
jgi:GNAT superfamily N-acetyltransferase